MTKIKNTTYQLTLLLLLPILVFGFGRRLPENISLESQFYNISDSDISFLRDLTYQDGDHRVYDQEIYPRAYTLIDSAKEFLVFDIFLFIETSVDTNPEYIRTTSLLANKLIEKKKQNPDMPIYFISDEFNIFYYSHHNKHFEMMKDAGIEVIVTDMLKMRDSHLPYSIFWRLVPRWFGNPNYSGWLPNVATEPEEKMAVRSLFKLVNFKANHRKIIMSEREAIITSANPHTASSLHSNIGFVVRGEILQNILDSEKAVANISHSNIDIEFTPESTSGAMKLKYISEGKIRKNLIKCVDKLHEGDSLDICVFYMSDRKLIKSIKEAKERGANIRLMLDANKDAFGKEKNGIPNRQVAHELHKQEIPIRWANTHGEQFHTKIAIFTTSDSVYVVGGSANFTKRNIGDKNLETDILVQSGKNTEFVKEVKNYYKTIWFDDRYSMDFENYAEKSRLKYLLYRYQEWTGAATF